MNQYSAQSRHHVFYAIVVSVLAHVLLFSIDDVFIKTTQVEQSGRALTLVLRKLQPVKSTPADSESTLVSQVKADQVAKVVPDEASDRQSGSVTSTSDQQALQLEPSKPKQKSGWELYRQAILSVRKGSFRRPLSKRTFSTDDLPLKREAKPGSPSRPRLLPSLISQPSRSERQDDFGQAMVKISDGFGNIVCMQERSDWSDGGIHFKGAADRMRNPVLMYRLSKEQCGHLD